LIKTAKIETGLKGYETLARLMGIYPYLGIFRRFGALNLQNMIYLPEEIVQLEQDLSNMVAEDNHNPDPKRNCFQEIGTLTTRGGDEEPENPWYQLILQIRKVLNDYSQ
jgi:hypothetical protein